MTIRPLLSACLFVSLSMPASAQTEREHEAHIHGQARVEIALENGALALALEVPGMDIVGFERPPANDAETRKIDAAIRVFAATDNWLHFEPANACTIIGNDPHAHGYAGHDDNSTQSDHEHEGHAKFHIELKANCDTTPSAVQIALIERFPQIESIQVDYVTETVQNRVALTAGDRRVPLQ
jgi:hypothetical protein